MLQGIRQGRSTNGFPAFAVDFPVVLASARGCNCAVDAYSPFDQSPSPDDSIGMVQAGQDAWEGGTDIVRLTIGRPGTPFVWQHDRRLLLLDEDAGLWSFAELEFDPVNCRYVEIRRSGYEMEREAIGVLLSRALSSGFEEVARASVLLNDWLIRYFGHTISESRARPGSRSL